MTLVGTYLRGSDIFELTEKQQSAECRIAQPSK